MFKVTTFLGKKVAVFGLGRSGNPTALALQAGGAEVYAWDDNENSRNGAIAIGVNVRDFRETDFDEFNALVMSPGVPIYGPKMHWSAQLASEHSVPIIGDIEIFAREINILPPELAPKVVGITGTNGKSTTTALIAHILQNAGKDVRMGGNIGTGIMSLESPRAGAFYVLELSSYQLDLSKTLRLDVAVQLNISEDHLERHGNIERYVAAKRNIFANQSRYDTAVIGIDEEWGEAQCTQFVATGNRNIIPISAWSFLSSGVCAPDGILWDAAHGRPREIANLNMAKALPGAHNWQNAAAAYAACSALGLNSDTIIQGIMNFGGLKHRLQEVATLGNVKFYNDSKATNADASLQALRAFDKLRWIVGGEDKTDGIEPLIPYFNRVTKAYLIGKAAKRFAKTLGDVPHQICGDMKTAVRAAYEDSLKSYPEFERIVLSPACASFDQYKDFEARGDDFIDIVNEIVNENAKQKLTNILPFTTL